MTLGEIAQFIPGVTPALFSFLIWGTTTRYGQEIWRLLSCACLRKERANIDAEEPDSGRAGVRLPRRFLGLPTPNSPMEMSADREMNVMNGKGKYGDVEAYIHEL